MKSAPGLSGEHERAGLNSGAGAVLASAYSLL